MNEFELGPIRPPDEANSLLIRTTRGCPWNRCSYCTLFKDMQFSIRKVEDIKQDIYKAGEYYDRAPFKTCFLQDGDSFAMRTKDLLEVLTTLKEVFPSLERISSYGRARSMKRKSGSEIQEICDAGLNMLYCGIESGSDQVLELVQKGVTAESITESLLKAKHAGMKLVTFVIFGLGGKELSETHINESAKVLNQINPFNIRVMSLALRGETELGNLIDSGSFTMLSEVEMVQEQQKLISQLHGLSSRYSNSHNVNLLNEVVGAFPEDKDKLLNIIKDFLSLSDNLKENYILGKRLGYYHRLADLENSSTYDFVEQQLIEIKHKHHESIDSIFHDLRCRGI